LKLYFELTQELVGLIHRSEPSSPTCDERKTKKVSLNKVFYCPTALLIAVIVEVRSPALLKP
jgi:hypothetical protein